MKIPRCQVILSDCYKITCKMLSLIQLLATKYKNGAENFLFKNWLEKYADMNQLSKAQRNYSRTSVNNHFGTTG